MTNIDELSRAIGNLEGTVKQGFQSVNNRLDTINGSVKNHEIRINTNETKIDQATGGIKIIGIIWGIIVVFISWFFSFKKGG